MAAGVLPEKWTLVGYPWFDSILISKTPDYERGDDREALATWIEDCQMMWLSDGRTDHGINFHDFILWVTNEYEEPHWLDSLKASGLYEEWTRHLQQKSSNRDDQISSLMLKHGGNKTRVAEEMGLSRTRLNQLLEKKSETIQEEKALPKNQRVATAADPFGVAAKSLKNKKK